MPLNISSGQVFRHFKTGDIFSLDFPVSGVARLWQNVHSTDEVVFPVRFHFSASDLLDEIEAGVWLPADPESTFVGRRPATEKEQIQDCIRRLAVVFNDPSDLLYPYAFVDEKEVAHA